MIMSRSLILSLCLLPVCLACVSDKQCPSFYHCASNGECVEAATLGRNCSSTAECQHIDIWSDCIDNTCQCTTGSVDYGHECVNLKPRFGKSREAKIAFYALLAVTSVLSIGLGVAELVERRCRHRNESLLQTVAPVTAFANDAFESENNN